MSLKMKIENDINKNEDDIKEIIWPPPPTFVTL